MPSPALLETQRAFSREVKDPGSAKRRPGMHVYQTAYRLRTEEALACDFEEVQELLGKNRFSMLTKEYLKERPSTSWTLSHLGKSLSDFLETHSLKSEFPFLPDLARWEWACAIAALSDEPKNTDIPVDIAEAQLILSPTAHLLELKWSLRKKTQRINRIVVARTARGVESKTVSALEFYFLQSLKQPAPMSDFLERIALQTNPQTFSRWIARWVANGWIQLN